MKPEIGCGSPLSEQTAPMSICNLFYWQELNPQKELHKVLQVENLVQHVPLHIWTIHPWRYEEALRNQGFIQQAYLLLRGSLANTITMGVTVNRACVTSDAMALIVCLEDKG